jgi:3-mercaptopropionate dioxygenase
MLTASPPITSPILRELAQAIQTRLADAHDASQVPTRVAAILQPFLRHPRLLLPSQTTADPTCYQQHILYSADAGCFSIVALVWLPGQLTPIHDHVCWCVVGVHEGQEQEVQYRRVEAADGSYLQVVGTSRNPAGSVAALTPPGDIHQVINPGPTRAISIHVYGADIHLLGTSIRRRYHEPVLNA